MGLIGEQKAALLLDMRFPIRTGNIKKIAAEIDGEREGWASHDRRFVWVERLEVHHIDPIANVAPEMLLERFCESQPPPADRASALRRLSACVQALQKFKIGNVLTTGCGPDGMPVLRLLQEHLQLEAPIELP